MAGDSPSAFTSMKLLLLGLLWCLLGETAMGVQQVVERRGSMLVLPCSGSTDPSAFTLVWLKDDEQIARAITETPGTRTVSVTNTLPHIEVGESDFMLRLNASTLGDNGIYTCRGLSEPDVNGTEEELFEENTRVLINDIPERPPGQPEVQADSPHQLEVDWSFSQNDNNSPITNYIILVRSEDDNSWEGAVHVTVEADVNQTSVGGLTPYTGYQVQVKARNAVGDSLPSATSRMVTTHEAVPSSNAKPRIIHTESYQNAIHIDFRPPPRHTLNGQLQGYLLKHKRVDSEDSMMTSEFNPNLTSHNFTNLTPATLYRINIMAFNDQGEGPPTEVVLFTKEGIPSKPRITNIAYRNDTMLSLEWERPEQRNGQLQGYYIYVSSEQAPIRNITVYGHSENAVVSYDITDLKPYTSYELQVAAFTKAGVSERSDEYPGLTDVRAPSAPTITNLTSNSSTALRVEWMRPEEVYKQIDQYQIKYRAADSSFYEEMTILGVNPEMSSPEVKEDAPDIHGNVVAIIISDLRVNTRYEVQVAGATKSIFYEKYFTGRYSEARTVDLKADTPPALDHHMESLTTGVLVGIVCTGFLLIIAIIAFLCMRRYMKRNYQFIADPETSNHVTNTVITLPETFDIEHDALTLNDFIAHTTALHADTDLGFSQEYEEINRNIRSDLTADQSTDPENKHKNRYINILAYDHSRVLLKPLPGKTRYTDYVNANFVDGYQCQRRYIASQGPLPTTFADFWRMVWEQNSVVVCMITNLTERGRRKCDQYWPNEGEATYGSITVKFMNIFKMAHYSIRVFTIKNLKIKKKGNQPSFRNSRGSQKCASERIVYQYHYTDWPDHGVPNFTLPVLMYVRKSAAASPDTAGPIVIHCSAGVGRTGTYIMLDTMMRQIKDKETVSVYGFLSHIRNQRNYLVQTEDQYIFIHDALVEFIKSGETEIKDSNISKYMDDLLTVTDGQTLLKKQYDLVTSFQPKDFHIHSAMQAVNTEKNRSQDIIPVELARVRLPAQPGEEGSDYINASFLQGYNKNDEYIITQHPLKSTISDFWRMIWDQNSMTVLLLSEPDEEDFPVFWPLKDETMECGPFNVTLTEETHNLGYVTRDFILQSTQKTLQEYYECNTRIFSTSLWPDSCTPLSQAFELVQTVKSWHQEKQEVDGPIVVIDKLGSTEAALFCGLSTLQDQLTQEGSVDVYMVASLYHLKRPGIFPKQDDFYLLYKAVDSICEDPLPAGDRDSGISNCNNYPNTMPSHYTSNSLSNDTRKETTM